MMTKRSTDDTGEIARSRKHVEITQNQLWIASKAFESLFVGVLGVEGSKVRVIPLDTKGDIYECGESVVPSNFSPLKMPMLAWKSLEALLPIAVFRSFMGNFEGNLNEIIEQNRRSEDWLEDHVDELGEEIREVSGLLESLARPAADKAN